MHLVGCFIRRLSVLFDKEETDDQMILQNPSSGFHTTEYLTDVLSTLFSAGKYMYHLPKHRKTPHFAYEVCIRD